jgi:hypothetical protein
MTPRLLSSSNAPGDIVEQGLMAIRARPAASPYTEQSRARAGHHYICAALAIAWRTAGVTVREIYSPLAHRFIYTGGDQSSRYRRSLSIAFIDRSHRLAMSFHRPFI